MKRLYQGVLKRILKTTSPLAFLGAVASVNLAAQVCPSISEFESQTPSVQLTPMWPALGFSHIVQALQTKVDPNYWYVTEQQGTVLRVPKSANAAKGDVQIFMDIKDRVLHSGELGLLSIAFSPQYQVDHKLYVFYSAIKHSPFQTRLSRFTVNSDYSAVDRNSEEILLTYEKPFENHNGGTIMFGQDGFLYISTGDGGSGGDPHNNSQNLKSWLGKMLRIDVSGRSSSKPYKIPTSNPFYGKNVGLEEIYAYGFRNPWRWSFDSVTGQGWIGDVGQDRYEEVDMLQAGGNYGWKLKEGNECFASSPCNNSSFINPVVVYDRSFGSSITGGYVYHGGKSYSMSCAYFYGDFATGKIWALRQDSLTKKVANKIVLDTNYMISSFGEALDGELVLLHYGWGNDGMVYKINF